MIHIFDTLQLGHTGIVAATALQIDDGLALFDTGPESTFNNVASALRSAGFELSDVRHVFLSHIHFDHAGAAWRFATGSSADTGATVYVHPRGAPHLIDPTKLIESATRIFGNDMERLWGKIAPVSAERVKVLEDNDIVRVPPYDVRAIATPGHANHHHVYHWADNIFGGDIAGVRIGNGPPIPPFVPPELDIEAWHESITKIRMLKPASLYLPHFGKVKGSVSEHLDALDERVTRWSEWLRTKIDEGEEESKLKSIFADYEHADLRAGGASEPEINGYEAADPSYMAVSAAIRYWRKFRAQSLSERAAT